MGATLGLADEQIDAMWAGGGGRPLKLPKDRYDEHDGAVSAAALGCARLS
jgi:hypothetical protein